MNSSDLETEMNADNSSMITPSKRDIFLSTYRHQNFSLPNSMMHYIAKNPKNSKGYQKMVESCKYFFVKNPILILSNLQYYHKRWESCLKNDWKTIDTNEISTKLWIADKLCVFPADVSNDSVVSSIIPKIYRCDAKYLYLENQFISLNEFMFLCSSAKELHLKRVTVEYNDGTVVAFEKLVEQIPKVKKFEFTFTTLSNNTTKNTFKELWKIPHLSNYDCFELINVPENFDIDSFYSFMKKNKNTRVYLYFSHQISEESKTRLELIIDEIIGTKNHDYNPPYINLPGLDHEKFFKVLHLYLQ